MALPWPPWQRFGRNKFLYAVFLCQRNVTKVETFIVEQNFMWKAISSFLDVWQESMQWQWSLEQLVCSVVFHWICFSSMQHGKWYCWTHFALSCTFKPRLRWQTPGKAINVSAVMQWSTSYCRACTMETCTEKQSTCLLTYLNNHNTGNIENYGSTVGTANLLSRRSFRLKWTLRKALSVFLQTMKLHSAARKLAEISDSHDYFILFWDSL